MEMGRPGELGCDRLSLTLVTETVYDVSEIRVQFAGVGMRVCW
jgi:hypothetical protein